jgi:DNA-binding LacI/PurR family transcriptional regulator
LHNKVPVAGFTDREVKRLQLVFTEQEARSIAVRFMHPLFERALAFPAITAWVCANDGMASSALDYLRQKGIAVPQRISIIGFDDELAAALDNKMTSFNFNRHECVKRMIDYVLHPGLSARSRASNVTEVEGFIVERQTTGRPGDGVRGYLVSSK